MAIGAEDCVCKIKIPLNDALQREACTAYNKMCGLLSGGAVHNCVTALIVRITVNVLSYIPTRKNARFSQIFDSHVHPQSHKQLQRAESR